MNPRCTYHSEHTPAQTKREGRPEPHPVASVGDGLRPAASASPSPRASLIAVAPCMHSRPCASPCCSIVVAVVFVVVWNVDRSYSALHTFNTDNTTKMSPRLTLGPRWLSYSLSQQSHTRRSCIASEREPGAPRAPAPLAPRPVSICMVLLRLLAVLRCVLRADLCECGSLCRLGVRGAASRFERDRGVHSGAQRGQERGSGSRAEHRRRSEWSMTNGRRGEWRPPSAPANTAVCV